MWPFYEFTSCVILMEESFETIPIEFLLVIWWDSMQRSEDRYIDEENK